MRGLYEPRSTKRRSLREHFVSPTDESGLREPTARATLPGMSARRLPAVVMLVGGDDEVARACARAASPLPVVRAGHRDVATDRLRELRPLAVYVANDVPAAEASVIGDVAAAHSTPLINLAVDGPEVVHERMRR
jgi:hypothetical protein